MARNINKEKRNCKERYRHRFILTERKINLEKEVKEIYSLYGKELSAIQPTKNEFLK